MINYYTLIIVCRAIDADTSNPITRLAGRDAHTTAVGDGSHELGVIYQTRTGWNNLKDNTYWILELAHNYQVGSCPLLEGMALVDAMESVGYASCLWGMDRMDMVQIARDDIADGITTLADELTVLNGFNGYRQTVRT